MLFERVSISSYHILIYIHMKHTCTCRFNILDAPLDNITIQLVSAAYLTYARIPTLHSVELHCSNSVRLSSLLAASSVCIGLSSHALIYLDTCAVSTEKEGERERARGEESVASTVFII